MFLEINFEERNCEEEGNDLNGSTYLDIATFIHYLYIGAFLSYSHPLQIHLSTSKKCERERMCIYQ